MMYCYSERGDVALVKPNPEEFEVVSSFQIRKGSGEHWAHPVIRDGRLYVRQGDALICEPLFGKSGLISTMVDSDGLVKVDMNTEGLYEGQSVKVLLSRDPSFGDIP